ncbi:MAG: metallopeptidase TldD-related protein [Planctomycetota bacterium]
MALLEQDHAFEIADALISESDADETEVSIHCVEDRFVRFAADGPTQAADRERYALRVRARYSVPQDAGGGFREASASAGDLDEESAFAALDRASLLASLADPDPGAAPLGGSAPVEPTAPSRPTQDHTVREKGAWISAALDAAEEAELDASGLARSGVACAALVNSAGRRVFGATSRASFELSCADRGADAETLGGAAAGASVAPFVDQVSVDGTVADVVEAAVQSRAPEAFDPEPTDVVLAPAAVAALLTFAAGAGFGAREFSEGSSFLTGRVGDAVLDPRVTVRDDVTDARIRGLRFDGEGQPRERVSLVEGGVLGRPVTDRTWASRLGLPNTGHGAPQPSARGPLADALVMEARDRSVEELCADVGDGLFVRQLHYVNLIEPKELVLTGMTRGGTFRIEDGRVGAPVRNLRFTQSLVRALQDVIGVGDTALRQGSLMGQDVVVPALAVRGFAFTSA